MDKHFQQWLATTPIPMFDIRYIPSGRSETWQGDRFLKDCYEVTQDRPRRVVLIETDLDNLKGEIQKHFKWARTPVGEMAIVRAINDLRLNPWWGSAGPITEEMRYLLREGFRHLSRYVRVGVQRSPVKQLLDHPAKGAA